MSTEPTEAQIEAAAKAIKREMGKQFNAQPLHGHPENWHATGGSLDLMVVARAALRAANAEK